MKNRSKNISVAYIFLFSVHTVVFCFLRAGIGVPLHLCPDSLMIPTSFLSSGMSSGWPMAQTLCLCNSRRFFTLLLCLTTFFFTSDTLRPSEATSFTLSATCCHSRAFLALVTPTLCPPNNTAFLFLEEWIVIYKE